MYIYSLPGLLSVAYIFMNSGSTDKCSFLFSKETLHQMETITETTTGHNDQLTDCEDLSLSGYIHNTTAAPVAQETVQKRKQKH